MTSNSTNSPTVRVPGLRAMLLFLVCRRPAWRTVCPKTRRNTTVRPRLQSGAPPMPYVRDSAGRRLRIGDQHRLVAKQIGEHALEVLHLRRVVEDDVGLVRVLDGVVLVIGL